MQLSCQLLLSLIFACLTQLRAVSLLHILRSPPEECPRSYKPLSVWQNYAPENWQEAGQYVKVFEANNLEDCLAECCCSSTCNVVIFQEKCYHIQCYTNDACEPRVKLQGNRNLSMVKVRSVEATERLENSDQPICVKRISKIGDVKSGLTFLQPSETTEDGSETNYSAEKITFKSCRVSANNCGKNEICKLASSRPPTGYCDCLTGYVRDIRSSRCVAVGQVGTLVDEVPELSTSSASELTNKVPEMKELVVFVPDEIIQLPNKSVSLKASVDPSGTKYRYEWTLVHHPSKDETGVMQDTNTDTLKLENLREGLYTFKVTVTDDNSSGTAFANVTVLPPKRFNKLPVVIIQPPNSTVQLPNKETVLDGSFSTDDDKIVSYKWEPVAVPIGYQPAPGLDLSSSTLQLKNLVPGSYKFQLTVTDSDGATNSAFANVTVLKEIDYPPTANAGQDVIIYAPQNEVVLNGNSSTDDKGIVGWLWTRSADEEKGKAVDMDGTTTPYLHLSKLGLGVYKFALKVTDTAKQTSTAEVHVFVKPETNTVPVANAGESKQVSLPLEQPLILDGSKSKDDSVQGIVKWQWKQLSGPKSSNILNATEPVTEVDGLIPGVYTFALTVSNAKGASANASVNVTVIQTKNLSPVANAGGDKTVTLPCTLVSLNGSRSTDDIGIASYKWTQESDSLASVTVVQDSDKSSILYLTDLVSGQYTFRLTVTDGQGATDSDAVKLIVKPSPRYKDEIQLLLNAEITNFSYNQEVNTIRKLELLLSDGKNEPLKLSNVRIVPQIETNRVNLLFVVDTASGKPVSGPEVVRKLKMRLKADPSLIIPEVLSLETVVCQNNCSGHGLCDQYTKQCVCEAFWMEDAFRIYFGDGETNCDWSILYVVIIAFTSVVCISGIFWSTVCFIAKRPSCKLKTPRRRYRRTRTKRNISQRYTLLENNYKDADSSDLNDFDAVNETKIVPVKNLIKKHINFPSDDDSDSDLTLFDSSTRKNISSNNWNNAKRADGSVKTPLNGLVSNGVRHKVNA